MSSTDVHRSSSGMAFSILSRRRDQVHSIDTQSPTARDIELEAFQRNVADRLRDLASVDSNELLSIPWLRNLLDVFLCCQEEFRAILFNNKRDFKKSPMERHVLEFFDRSVKALDVCNAIRDGIDQIRQWQKQLEIVLCALGGDHRSIGEGQFRRAKKALTDLTFGLVAEKESNAPLNSHRNRSFGRSNQQKSISHFRSLSWSVSRNWSAARQLQAIGTNLVPPRPNEIAATNGLTLAVFTMNYVLLFVMWALVAAIPCQDRGIQTNFNITKQFLWAGPIMSLHERIMEESRKRERKNACGLLKDIGEIDKCCRHLNELTDCVNFPLTDEKERELRYSVKQVGNVYRSIKDGLDPLEREVRNVFRRIVRSRTDGLDSIGHGN